jgi:hypothetical protein
MLVDDWHIQKQKAMRADNHLEHCNTVVETLSAQQYIFSKKPFHYGGMFFWEVLYLFEGDYLDKPEFVKVLRGHKYEKNLMEIDKKFTTLPFHNYDNIDYRNGEFPVLIRKVHLEGYLYRFKDEVEFLKSYLNNEKIPKHIVCAGETYKIEGKSYFAHFDIYSGEMNLIRDKKKPSKITTTTQL